MVRMLNLAAGGTILISDSRVIWSTPSSGGNHLLGCRWDQDPLVSELYEKTVVCVSVTAADTV